MAIDTAAKAYSAMGVAMPWMPLVYPDATLSEEWRATAAFTYGGNALSAVAVRPSGNLCIKASQLYSPGSSAAQVYSHGAEESEVYMPGASESQVGC